MYCKDVVAFLFVKNNQYLIEKRKMTKKDMPGALVIPVGIVEKNENIEDVLLREVDEELTVKPTEYKYLATLKEKFSDHISRIHYYTITSWEGEIKAIEAEGLLWLKEENLQDLALEVDRVAIHEYERTKTFEF